VLGAGNDETERDDHAELIVRRSEPRRHLRRLTLDILVVVEREHLHEARTHAVKPRASRIASRGAGRPVQSSKLAAPCATSTSSPSRTRAPAATAASAVAVRGYGRSTSAWPDPSSNLT